VGLVDRLQPGDPSQIGPFRLLSRLGEGGMGRVFLGESPGGRNVAIKVVHPHYASDPEFCRRFAREVAAARQVGGFHTAAVVGADPDAYPPWMASAYIPGPSLAEAVSGGGPLDEAGVRRLGAALAEGLAAIHDCGLIHRDLKPSNVILAADGPRILDFGIAKAVDATALTGSSAVIGTLRYMSPEQLQGQQVTPQSDVFALGTVLAYAATGNDPFAAPTMPAVITRILTGLPDLDLLSGDLRGIIGECLAKNPSDRPTPGDLLARFGRPVFRGPAVTAPPAPAPAPVPAAGPVLLPDPAPEPWSAESGGAVRAAREPFPASTVNVSAVVPAGRTDPPAAAASRPARKPARSASRRRTGLIAAGAVVVVGLATVGIFMLVNRPAPRLSGAGTPPATSSATATHQASASTAAGKLTATLTPPNRDPGDDPITMVAFGPGGTLATGNNNGSIYLWNTATGKLTATLTNPGGDPPASMAFGPGGILASGGGGVIYLWNTATGKLTATLTNPANPGIISVYSVAFGPGGTLAAGEANNIYLWNTATGKLTATLTGPANLTTDSAVAAFGPGGTLATGYGNGSIYLWNTATGKITATLTNPGRGIITSLAFGPDGTLASAGGSSVYLWNTATGKLTATLTSPGPASSSMAVTFGPDGTLATGYENGSTYLWNTTTDKIIATLTNPGNNGGYWVAFGPNGTFATSNYTNAYLWHITYG
jgi:WD40 repeat protein